MSKPQLRVIKNEATKSAEIYLYGIIGDFWFEENALTARGFQQQLNMLGEYDEIHIHINSPGGDCLEGIAICNTIKASKKNIHTYNDGICASMAAIILLSAKSGKRHAAKGSLMMMHCASTCMCGNAEEMREEADVLEKYDDVLAEFLCDALSKPLAEVKSLYFNGKDLWLTAKEAESQNMVVIDDYEAGDMPNNPTALKFNQVAAFYNQKFNNSDMSLIQFNNPFKGISALAKVPVKDVTDAQLKAVHDELEAEGIKGFTMVKTTDLTETVTNSEKVAGLDKKITDLETASTADKKKITDLELEVTTLKKKLGEPAEEITAPPADKTDITPKDENKVLDNFETSFDREFNARFGK